MYLDYDPDEWVYDFHAILETSKEIKADTPEIRMILSEMISFLKEKNIWERVFERNSKMPDFLVLLEKLLVAGKQDLKKLISFKRNDCHLGIPKLEFQCRKEVRQTSEAIFGPYTTDRDESLAKTIKWSEFLEKFEETYANNKGIKMTEGNKSKLQHLLDPSKTGNVERKNYDNFATWILCNILKINVPFFED